MKRNNRRFIFGGLGLALLLALASLSVRADSQVVLVENTDIGRLHYPVYITKWSGFSRKVSVPGGRGCGAHRIGNYYPTVRSP